MDETELGQRAHALPQLICFWWIRSGKVKNFRTGLVQVHRRYRLQKKIIKQKADFQNSLYHRRRDCNIFLPPEDSRFGWQ